MKRRWLALSGLALSGLASSIACGRSPVVLWWLDGGDDLGEGPGDDADSDPEPPEPSGPPEPDIGCLEGAMVDVPAGWFIMGCDRPEDPDCQYFDDPAREIYVDAFAIDKCEVRVTDYQRCVDEGECAPASTAEGCNSGVAGREDHPINCVLWSDAAAFCEFVGKRLPTEAEWEKAARGTDGRTFPWGDQPLSCTYAVWGQTEDPATHGCDLGTTWPVGAKPAGASPYGALDMAGNVYDWIQDWYQDDYYQVGPVENPRGPPSGTDKVHRGGAYGAWAASVMRSSNRNYQRPEVTGVASGLRCAL